MTSPLLSLTDASLSLKGNAGQVDILRSISLDVQKG
ncbi:MAG: ABC transporter, partial [Rhodobacteraceae bacterium]|nr:ABC transporter [Paracoccaceae bacterium]